LQPELEELSFTITHTIGGHSGANSLISCEGSYITFNYLLEIHEYESNWRHGMSGPSQKPQQEIEVISLDLEM
jgi:hypothetical protein